MGEVVYDWSIPDDTIAWGKNATDVLGVASLDRIATGEPLATSSTPKHPESRHEAVLKADGEEGGGAYRVEYPFHPAGTA